MTVNPETLKTAWEKRDVPLVLATVDADGTPNAKYVLFGKLLADGLKVGLHRTSNQDTIVGVR